MISKHLLASLESTTAPKTRQEQAAKARRVLSEDSAVNFRVKIAASEHASEEYVHVRSGALLGIQLEGEFSGLKGKPKKDHALQL